MDETMLTSFLFLCAPVVISSLKWETTIWYGMGMERASTTNYRFNEIGHYTCCICCSVFKL